MESTRQQKQDRANRQHDMAVDFVRRAERKISRDGVLQAPEIGTVFALACAMSIVKWHNADPATGKDLAGMVLRVIIKNLAMHGVPIPDLGVMTDRPMPNIHDGTDSQH